MEALGSVSRRLGQLTIQPLGPQVRPRGASPAPRLRDSGLQGRPAGLRTNSRFSVTLVLRLVEVRTRPTQQEHRTPSCAHAP